MAPNALEKLQAKVEKAAALLAALFQQEKQELQKLRGRQVSDFAKTLGRTYRAQVRLWGILKKSWLLGKDPIEEGLLTLTLARRKALPEELHAIADLEELLQLIRDSRDSMAQAAAAKLSFILENANKMMPDQLADELEALGRKAPLNPALLNIAARKIKELAQSRREAILDPMTSFETLEEHDGLREAVRRDVYNQRGFDLRISEEVARAARDRRDFSVLYFDLNDFKDINDTYGHDAGDEALRHFVRIVHSIIRKTDTVIRKGGDEFVIVFPGLSCEQSTVVGDKIREALAGTNLVYKGQSILVDVSYGCATFASTKTLAQVKQVLKDAEARMYAEKRKTKARKRGETTIRR